MYNRREETSKYRQTKTYFNNRTASCNIKHYYCRYLIIYLYRYFQHFCWLKCILFRFAYLYRFAYLKKHRILSMGVFTSNSTTYYDNSGCYGKTMQIVHRHKDQVWYGVNYIDLDMPSSILYKIPRSCIMKK